MDIEINQLYQQQQEEEEQKQIQEQAIEQDHRKYSSDEEDEEDDEIAYKQKNEPNKDENGSQINNQYGGDAQKQKKKKKKKRKRDLPEEEETDYEVDILKKAKTSKLLLCEAIQDHLRQRYSLIEANPWLLIVSDIPRMITDIEIKEFFNILISKLRPELAEPMPVVKVDVMTNGQFATMHMSCRLAKIFALTLRGVEFQKCKLMIERPKQYFYRMYMEKQQNDDVMVDVDDGALQQMQMNKIYMGGLPTYLKDIDVKKLCETFGKLKYFNVAKQQNENKEQVSKGYCFFEYEDPNITEKAIKALNGLPCGDRKLKVSRVNKDQNKLANTQQIQSEKSKLAPSNNSGSFLGGSDLIRKEQFQKLLTIPEFTSLPSRVIQLLNMVSIEDLFEDDIIDDLYQDVMTECEKIGPVEKIEIPKPCKTTGICPPCIGKVFVKFKYMIKAKKARYSLNGRTYNRRTVIASFYPEDKFDRKDFLVSIL
ncbi:hypothetical protein ABPG72_021622 [Tetrahymena utriculariae]